MAVFLLTCSFTLHHFNERKKTKTINYTITGIKQEDCFRISDIINSARKKHSLLERSPEEILSIYKNYFIAVSAEGKILGTVGFKIWGGDQPEIISFIVLEKYRNIGIGTALIEECIRKIRERNYKKIFALTATPSIFKKLEFEEVDISDFPQKINGNCKNCPRNASGPNDRPKCDEIALSLKIS